MTAVLTVAGVGVLVASLVGLLRLGRAVGERLRRDDGTTEPADVRPMLSSEPGWLSEEDKRIAEEQQRIAEANERDLARIAAAHRVFEHEMNVLFERTLRDPRLDLDQTSKNWARVASGDDHLVGVEQC